MSTKSHSPALDAALANVPTLFRTKIISSYIDLKRNCAEARYDPAGLSVGKLCEVVLRFLQKQIFGTYTPFGTKVVNYADESRKLIMSPQTAGSESERVIIPRALVFLYTMRNKRGIGHVGGDVDANARINHGLSLEEAQDLIDGISVRQLPTIWEVAGKKRVLKEGLKSKDQVLMLLYSSVDSAVLIEDLCDWVEYSNPAVFKSKVIGPLHKARLVEHDAGTDSVFLSPKGATFVEQNLI
jgi:hypothetical protein